MQMSWVVPLTISNNAWLKYNNEDQMQPYMRQKSSLKFKTDCMRALTITSIGPIWTMTFLKAKIKERKYAAKEKSYWINAEGCPRDQLKCNNDK